METKKCNCCSVVFPIEDFAFKNKAEGIRINFCSNCRKIKSKSSYEKHKQTNLKRTAKNKLKSLEWYKNLKKTLSCCVCGEKEPECLDFHHIDSSEKDFILSEIKRESIGRMKNELNKCACLCANCHRKHHAEKLFAPLVKLDII
jgi:hypothetical protein